MTEPASFRSLINRMSDLPSIPSSVARVKQILDDPESSGQELSDAISQDQSLTSSLLKIVNSAYYGFPRRIDTLLQAVALLGYRSIHDLVVVTSLFRQANSGENSSLNWESFWKHTVGCGAAAKALGRHIGAPNLETIFVAGIIHDIGKVFLDAYLNDEYAQAVRTAAEKGILIHEAERMVLGADHSDFGVWLAEEWNLPMNLTAAVTYHHTPNQAKNHFLLVCLVHVGDILARALEAGSSGDNLIPAINRQAWTALNISIRSLDKILEQIDRELAETSFDPF